MIQAMLDFFGNAICHQLQERSLQISGKPLSVCARDTGIYLGIFSTLIYFFLFKRNKIVTIPSIKVSFFLLLFMVPMMIDGLGSYAHLFESNNARRLITGLGFGFVLPYFIFPLLFGKALNPISIPIVKNTMDVIVPLLICSILGLLVYRSYLTYYLIDSLLILTIIIWFGFWTSLLYLSIQNQLVKWSLSILSSVAFLSILSSLHNYLIP